MVSGTRRLLSQHSLPAFLSLLTSQLSLVYFSLPPSQPLKQECLGLDLSCVTLSKSHTVSVPPFPPLYNGDNKSLQKASLRIK